MLNITLVDKAAGTSQIVQAWDALTNLPDAMAGRAEGGQQRSDERGGALGRPRRRVPRAVVEGAVEEQVGI